MKALRVARTVSVCASLAGLLACLTCLGVPVVTSSGADRLAPSVGQPAPDLRALDLDGKTRSLAEFRGRPVALFFFCGCPACTEVGREWGQMQRGGALSTLSAALSAKTAKQTAPATLVVYTLNNQLTREMSEHDGLDLSKTVLLVDPNLQASDIFHAHPCPRVFVLDSKGVLRYTNISADDAPPKGPAFLIVSRALDALRRTMETAAPSLTPTNTRKAGKL